jgi:hypothetical protein
MAFVAAPVQAESVGLAVHVLCLVQIHGNGRVMGSRLRLDRPAELFALGE